MDQLWCCLVRWADDFGDLLNDPLDVGRSERAWRLAVLVEQPYERPSLDVGIFQARGIVAQVGVRERHDAAGADLLLGPQDHLGLVSEQVFAAFVQLEAELQGYRRHAAQLGVAGFPDLAKAPLSQKPLQLPVGTPDWPVPWVEAQSGAAALGGTPDGLGLDPSGCISVDLVSTPKASNALSSCGSQRSGGWECASIHWQRTNSNGMLRDLRRGAEPDRDIAAVVVIPGQQHLRWTLSDWNARGEHISMTTREWAIACTISSP